MCIGCLGGLPLGGGCDDSSGGGAAGNLKFLEKEFEGFLPVVGRDGVLGVVVKPGLLRSERAGKAKSLVSRTNGEDASPESGEGCVADRWPGEATACMSAKAVYCVRSSSYLGMSLACQARPADSPIGHALLLDV